MRRAKGHFLQVLVTRFLLGLVLVLGACSRGEREAQLNPDGSVNQYASDITIKGSDTVLPVAQQEAEQYMRQHEEAAITVVGGGTGVGLAALQAGTTHIAMASRGLKIEEKLKLKGARKEVSEALIAYDALSVVVHPSNPLDQLTREQMEAIFTGKVRNWKEVGGPDLKIVAYSRETSSGTYEFFREEVLNKKNYAHDILMMPATGSIVQSVSQTPGAIGYIGLAYETKDVKGLKVSYDQGKTYVAPSMQAAKDKSYPISRPLFFFYETALEPKVKPFIDFILSPQGQKIVQETGYIPLGNSAH